jgi:hypothetical protein
MRAPPGTRTVVTRVLIGLSALAGLGLASPRCIAQEISDDWQFAATIYGWLPDIGGETRFPLGGDQTATFRW